jgi:uncharacterized membrane protein
MSQGSSESAAARRVVEMDAVRGAAMFAVCVAHSGYLMSDPRLAHALKLSGMLATPTFLLLSGLVCGYLSRAEGSSLQRRRVRLVDRGLFLLVIGHLILSCTHSIWMPPAVATLQSFYITDAVGLSLVVAGLLIGRVSTRTLLIMGAALYGGSVALDAGMFYFDVDAHPFLRVLLGAPAEDQEGYVVPAIPYLGIFMVGIAAGLEFSRVRTLGVTMSQVARLCQYVGLVCIAVALIIKAGGRLVLPRVDAAGRAVTYFLTAPSQKLPPGPTYLLTFGGAGLVMAGTLARMAQTRWRGVVSMFAVVGRASLITYIVQACLLVVPARIFDLPDSLIVWFAIAPASFAALWLLAYFWDSRGYNRFITVGLRKRGARPAMVPAT